MYKICNRCKKRKLLNQFGIHKNTKEGFHTICKSCIRIYNKSYYENNKEKCKESTKNYTEKNKIYLRKKAKIYRDKHKKQFKKFIKKYRKENWEKIAKQMLLYRKNRRTYDKNFQILINLRTRIHHALNGLTKSNKTIILLGCEIDYLMYHLQCQFKKGMTWDNYGYGKGKWVIDHIKPCCSFSLSKESEQKKCFHYSNLQPLWWKENTRKRSQDVKQRKKK